MESSNLIRKYAASDILNRLDIIITYYPNFLQLIEGYEKSLSIIIREEKAYARKCDQGDVGVRVMVSRSDDPTANMAMDNISILQSIQDGNLSNIMSDDDSDVIGQYQWEVDTLHAMKDDYHILNNTISFLDPEEANVFTQYLVAGRKTEKLAYDMDIKPGALRMKISRSKKTVLDTAKELLNKKYHIA